MPLNPVEGLNCTRKQTAKLELSSDIRIEIKIKVKIKIKLSKTDYASEQRLFPHCRNTPPIRQVG